MYGTQREVAVEDDFKRLLMRGFVRPPPCLWLQFEWRLLRLIVKASFTVRPSVVFTNLAKDHVLVKAYVLPLQQYSSFWHVGKLLVCS